MRRLKCAGVRTTLNVRLQETVPPQDPTGGLRSGPCGGPRGGGRFLMSEVPFNTGGDFTPPTDLLPVSRLVWNQD